MTFSKKLLLLLLLSFVYLQDCSKAQDLYNNGMYLDAYGEILDLGDNVYNDEDCTLLAYNILFKLEKFNESKSYLDKLFSFSPKSIEYNNLSSLLTKVLQNYKSAKYTLEKIDVDDAINEYNEILQDDELKNISLFYSGLGMAYKKKFMNSSNSDSLNFDLLDLSIENYKKAQNINSNYDDDMKNISKYLTSIGKKSMGDDDFSKALAYFTKATEYNPTYSTAHFYSGQLYMKIQDYELAIKSYEAGLGTRIKKGNYKVLYLLATCYQKLNNASMAEQLFGYSINNEPTYTKARFALANLYYGQQKYDASESTLLDVLKMDPEYIKAYELLVNISLDTKKYDLARDYSNQGISINPKSYFLYSQLSFLDNEAENYESAISNANESLSLKRNYGPALLELGRSYTFLCNAVAAEDAFKKAKRYDRRQTKQLQDWANGYHKEVCK